MGVSVNLTYDPCHHRGHCLWYIEPEPSVSAFGWCSSVTLELGHLLGGLALSQGSELCVGREGRRGQGGEDPGGEQGR